MICFVRNTTTFHHGLDDNRLLNWLNTLTYGNVKNTYLFAQEYTHTQHVTGLTGLILMVVVYRMCVRAVLSNCAFNEALNVIS